MKAVLNFPKISVLLPFYNDENTLEKAINSIINQTFNDWELILVNNASNDKSELIAKKLEKKDTRIIIIDEPKKGIVNALNTGLDYCQAEYVARMDADDISLPERLEKQFAFMKNNPKIDLCSGLVQHIADSKNNTAGYLHYINWINSLVSHNDIQVNRFIESPLAHPSVMFKKNAVNKYGKYVQGNFPEDYEIWLRWLSKGAIFGKTTHKILLWYDSPYRLSRTHQMYSKQAFNNIKLHYLNIWLKNNNPFYPDLMIWGAGKNARKNAETLKNNGNNIIGFIDVSEKKTLRNDCINYTDIHPQGKYFILNFVNNRGIANLIRKELNNKCYQEGKDYLMAAGM